MNKKEFLMTTGLSADDLSNAKLPWEELAAIYDDYAKKKSAYVATGNAICEQLRQIPEAHSLKMRVKDPNHLIRKVIRKEYEVTSKDYANIVTDLLGIRVLHLYKQDWQRIHDYILETWNLKDGEPVVANFREGDLESWKKIYEEKDCQLVQHPAGYRSVHYIVETSPTRNTHFAEIQVRTIFEEGWSEIDHQVRYPNNLNDLILAQFLELFNRLAGSADEMGAYVRFLAESITSMRLNQEELRKKHETTLAELGELTKQLKTSAQERRRLQESIDSLRKDLENASSLRMGLYGSGLTRTPDYLPLGSLPLDPYEATTRCAEQMAGLLGGAKHIVAGNPLTGVYDVTTASPAVPIDESATTKKRD